MSRRTTKPSSTNYKHRHEDRKVPHLSRERERNSQENTMMLVHPESIIDPYLLQLQLKAAALMDPYQGDMDQPQPDSSSNKPRSNHENSRRSSDSRTNKHSTRKEEQSSSKRTSSSDKPSSSKKSKSSSSSSRQDKPCKMAIVHNMYPDILLTMREEDIITDYLLQKIDEAAKDPIQPRFCSLKSESGILSVTVANDETKRWLQSTIAKSLLWPNARLKTVVAEKLVPPVQASIFIPGAAVEPEVILKRIQTQNGLDTSEWRTINMESQPNGQIMSVLMNRTSWHKIAKSDFKLFLNFSTVNVEKIRDSNSKVSSDDEQRASTSERRRARSRERSRSRNRERAPSREPAKTFDNEPSYLDAIYRENPSLREKHSFRSRSPADSYKRRERSLSRSPDRRTALARKYTSRR